jgi:nucleoside-diphosphate-sugar epimerase
MRVLITGGGGFIGSHLVDHFVTAGDDVCVLDNFATGRRENIPRLVKEVELVEGDIQSYERVHNAVRGCEVVLHQAALPSVPRSIQDPLTSNASNVIGTLNVLLAARDSGVRRVLFASSSSVYGARPEARKSEELATAPISPYGVAKLAAEGYCRGFFETYGLETVALRYFNVFGPRQDPLSQYAAVIPNFITALLSGDSPIVFGDGEQSRDFTYVDNVVDANRRALTAEGVAGKVYNIAGGAKITLNDLLAEIGSITGRECTPVYEDPRPGDIRHSLADVSHAAEDLGYHPEVDLREGLARTVEYYESLEDQMAASAASRE